MRTNSRLSGWSRDGKRDGQRRSSLLSTNPLSDFFSFSCILLLSHFLTRQNQWFRNCKLRYSRSHRQHEDHFHRWSKSKIKMLPAEDHISLICYQYIVRTIHIQPIHNVVTCPYSNLGSSIVCSRIYKMIFFPPLKYKTIIKSPIAKQFPNPYPT